MIDKCTFGNNPADICLAEELERVNDEAHTKTAQNIISSLSICLKAVIYMEDERAKNKLIPIIKEHYMQRANNSTKISDKKVKSYLLNTINGKINDASRIECIIK